MLKISSLILAVAALWLPSFGAEAALYKCVANGKVTYQERPCPSSGGPRPTVQELNAREKQRRAATAAAAAAAASSAAAFEEPAPAVPTASGGFRCDGRQMCAQMTSCAEAKYFLANCPGVKMDGNKDGNPCEKQWCNR